MRIAVLLKAVPRAEELDFDDRGYLRRSDVSLEINPYCRRALAKGIELAEETDGSCVAITMGPAASQQILVEALAVGADHAVFASDPGFAGADLFATANTLASVLGVVGPFDLVLCGKASVDAETGILPAMIAELLGSSLCAGVRELAVGETEIEVTCERDDGSERLRAALPAVVSCAERLCAPLRPEQGALALVDVEAIERIDLRRLPSGFYGSSGSMTSVGQVRVRLMERRGAVSRDSVSEWASKVAQAIAGVQREFEADALPDVGPHKSVKHPVLVVGNAEMTWLTRELLGEAAVVANQLGTHVVAVGVGAVDPTWVEGGSDYQVVLKGASNPASVSRGLRALMAEQEPSAVLIPSTTWGREVAGRLSALEHFALVSEVTAFEVASGGLRLWKSALGNVQEVEIHYSSNTVICTVAPGVGVPRVRRVIGTVPYEVKEVWEVASSPETIWRDVDDDLEALSQAHIAVGVGLGVGPEHYPAIQAFCRRIGAVLVGTRKVTDRHWLPHSRQVGATGRHLSCDVYVALGLSGRPMHVAGLHRVGTVFAVNHDPDAPIFGSADFGMVCTWEAAFQAVNDALTDLGYPQSHESYKGYLRMRGSQCEEVC